ncbi:MAG: phosphatase PAP2 family protein [Patescibacteria group bacterium]|nr:phosphatase PAP2 family protein [Patescibacteria group bacterium]MDE1945653.1 phosphatase PAP2 family protein [Patescibacteria group bacterium]
MRLPYKIIVLVVLLACFAALAALVIRHGPAIAAFDANAANWFSSIRSNGLDGVMLAVTKLGNPYETVGIFLVLGAFLSMKNRRSFYEFAIASGCAIAAVGALKILIDRPRPPMHLLFETGSSFPSAHATMATVYLLSAIILIAPLVKNRPARNFLVAVCAILFPVIALSRIYLSVHFASDVLAGIILGMASFLFATIAVRHHKETILSPRTG